MSESGPPKKLLIAALAGLLVVPAASLIAVVMYDRAEPAPALRPELSANAQAANPTSHIQAAAPEVKAPSGMARLAQPAQVPIQRPAAADSQVHEKLSLARRVENTDPKRSRELLREVLGSDPNNEQALERLAAKMLTDENVGEARDLAKRCASVNASNQACTKIIKELAVEVTPQVEALAKVVDECVDLDPKRIDCIYGKVNWLFMQGRSQEAEDWVERMMDLNPNAPQAMLGQARLKAADGAYGDARKLFQAACDQQDQYACYRAEVLRSEGW